MCAWPKGVPRGPRKKGNSLTLEQAMAASGMIVDINKGLKTVEAADVEQDEEKICHLEELPEWGFGFDSKNVVVYKRRRYEEDITVQKRVNGEDININYKAGDYSDWAMANGPSKGPFCGNLKLALLYIHNQNIKNSIMNVGVVKNLAQLIKDSEDKIMKVVKA